MRKHEMCVKIAKDVLAQLRLQRYKANPGEYVYIPWLDHIDMTDREKRDESFKDLFKINKNITCQICAIGAAFVSLVNIENKCSVSNMLERYNMWARLGKYFKPLTLCLMESAFEGKVIDQRDPSRELIKQAVAWGKQYHNDTDRLRVIMLNIIRNKGDFKLPNTYIAKANRTTGR